MTRHTTPAGTAPAHERPMPAQRSMKREARTAAENGEPLGPEDGAAITPQQPPRKPARPGDAGVGESDNQGSSPYSQRGLPEKPLRDE